MTANDTDTDKTPPQKPTRPLSKQQAREYPAGPSRPSTRQPKGTTRHG